MSQPAIKKKKKRYANLKIKWNACVKIRSPRKGSGVVKEVGVVL